MNIYIYILLMAWSILKFFSLTKNRQNIIQNIDIYYIGYNIMKSISNYESIHSGNPLYFIIVEVDGYIVEKMELHI